MKLSNFTEGRDNNFNLIRIIAALSVLVSHSFTLSVGTTDAAPFVGAIGISLGSIAVDCFFITSGLLVTASLLKRQNIIDFLWARTLRIFPALVIMLCLTVFGLGVFFTSMPLGSYLTDFATYKYFFKCATLIAGVSYTLPGVFDGNPFDNSVNGSLWTMPFEVRMYIILVFTWAVLQTIRKISSNIFGIAIIVFTTTSGAALLLSELSFEHESKFLRLFYMFSLVLLFTS